MTDRDDAASAQQSGGEAQRGDTEAVAQLATLPKLPRVAITYCTQCRWMLRAAYFGQELLSTFGTTIGEIALIPATGGIFTVELTFMPKPDASESSTEDPMRETSATKVLIWDRKSNGGFPETKVLKQLVRDRLDPKRDLGHSDRHGKKAVAVTEHNTEDKNDQNSKPVETEPEVAKFLPAEVKSNTQALETSKVKRNADGTVCEDCQ